PEPRKERLLDNLLLGVGLNSRKFPLKRGALQRRGDLGPEPDRDGDETDGNKWRRLPPAKRPYRPPRLGLLRGALVSGGAVLGLRLGHRRRDGPCRLFRRGAFLPDECLNGSRVCALNLCEPDSE